MTADAAGAARTIGGMTHLMAERMLAALPLRHARRSYTGERVAANDLAALAAFIDTWRPWPDARCVLVEDAPPSLFMGVIGSYGGISNAPSALAFIGSNAEATVGYTGEAAVLAAAAHGLDTCWVAGVFSPRVVGALVPLTAGERVMAVSALGYASPTAPVRERLLFGAGKPKKRRALDEIAPGHGSWPAWARAAVAAAQIAPSAMNRQPWRFELSEEGLTVSSAVADLPRAPGRLDCGIAMLHAELGAFGEGVTGTWRLLDPPAVALFTPER